MAEGSSTTGGVVPDHSGVAGTYLIVLGVLQLLGCNLAGLLFIWFGLRVKERSEGFRKASLWLLGLYLAALAFAIGWVAVKGTDGTTFSVWGWEWQQPPAWVFYATGAFALIVFGTPFYWLWQDSYRAPGAAASGG
jgi:hypothetical protein